MIIMTEDIPTIELDVRLSGKKQKTENQNVMHLNDSCNNANNVLL